MRLRVVSTILLVGLAIVSSDFPAHSSETHASTVQSDNQPRVYNVRIKGKKLILTGEHFMDGAVILVNGEPQKTRNDEESPSTTLIAKKAGKIIPDDTVVAIQVQSSNGLTDNFPFFKGLVITFADLGKPILLKTGDRFLLFLTKDAYEFGTNVLDAEILQKVNDIEVPGSQGVFEAKREGTTRLNATGQLPCHNTVPACLAPAINVEFTVIVSDFKLSD